MPDFVLEDDGDAFRIWAASGEPPSPNFLGRKGATLKAGPKVCKTVSVSLFGDGKTGEVSKRELRVSAFPAQEGGGFDFDHPEETWFVVNDEIEKLLAFLNSDVDHPGRYKVVDAQSPAADLLRLLDGQGGEVHEVLRRLAEISDPGLVADALASTGAGVTGAELAVICARRQLVEQAAETARRDGITETDMQPLLSNAWWMFGGRYIGVLQRRDLLNLDQHDIPLITADGSLHIVELKGPQIPNLIRKHRNHWIVGSEVHEAAMQASNYLRTADEVALQLQTLVEEELGIDVKLRRVFATVVAGHRAHVRAAHIPPGQLDLALRTYNSTLNRIEVITYDQLIDSAARSLQFDSV